eukprot:NODE_6_length_48303_cov_0.387022.p24 type:complete len:103 gc:universal NODE_6_length_48303_cov_0.387022:44343-44651(+)
MARLLKPSDSPTSSSSASLSHSFTKLKSADLWFSRNTSLSFTSINPSYICMKTVSFTRLPVYFRVYLFSGIAHISAMFVISLDIKKVDHDFIGAVALLASEV